MDLQPGIRLIDVTIDKVFIEFYTNSRIENLRIAGVQAIVVPGSGRSKRRRKRNGWTESFSKPVLNSAPARLLDVSGDEQ